MSGRSLRGRPVAIALAAAAVLAAMACGGGSAAPSGSGSSMAGMNMTSIGQSSWQGMKITVSSMTPQSFTVFEGTQQIQVQPTTSDSIHLMTVLADSQTGQPIPYATVWAVIADSAGKTVFDQRLWPMLSQSMGTYYGANVPLPAKGSYELDLRITPPQAARLPEYTQEWLQPQTVNMKFTWDGKR